MPRGQYDRRALQAQGERPEARQEPALAAPTRAAETRRERRRRDDGNLDRMGRMALSIPPEVRERLEREGKVARWVRDAPGRQAAMQANDWDITGNVDPVAEARDSEGKLVLMEKYKDWFDADQRDKMTPLEEREAALQRGAETSPDGSGDQGKYYADNRNSFSRKPGL